MSNDTGPRLEISGNIARIYGLTPKAIGAEPQGGSPELNQSILDLLGRIVALELSLDGDYTLEIIPLWQIDPIDAELVTFKDSVKSYLSWSEQNWQDKFRGVCFQDDKYKVKFYPSFVFSEPEFLAQNLSELNNLLGIV